MKTIFDTKIIPREICYAEREPVLMKGRVKEWPALNKWTWDYLKKLAGDRVVKLVVGNREHGPTQFTHLKLAEYIDILANPDTRAHKDKLYLKEFNLFAEFAEFAQDVQYELFFPWYVTPGKFAWVGEKGAVTGLHFDIFNNFLTQIRGEKTIFLFPQHKIDRAYWSNKFDYGARISVLDAFEGNSQPSPLEPIVVNIVPGDVLFIPKGWWHQVKSITPTISIASFMVSIRDRWTTEFWENTRKFAHNQGLYKKGNCTCHNFSSRKG